MQENHTAIRLQEGLQHGRIKDIKLSVTAAQAWHGNTHVGTPKGHRVQVYTYISVLVYYFKYTQCMHFLLESTV
jgi:hypothetical protein